MNVARESNEGGVGEGLGYGNVAGNKRGSNRENPFEGTLGAKTLQRALGGLRGHFRA